MTSNQSPVHLGVAAPATARGTETLKINIATPCYGAQYSGSYVRTLYRLLSNPALRRVQFSFSDIDCADIVVARNYLISNFYFMKPECSHILFWDDDMGFEPDLLTQMLQLEKDVVGVIYPRRAVNFGRMHAHSDQPFAKAYARACDFIGGGFPNPDAGDTFVKVRQCGTGVLLISRACIDTMVRKCPAIVDKKRFKNLGFANRFEAFLTPFNKIDFGDSELGEDFSFCHRWVEECGGEIHASVSHAVEHVGQLTVKTRYLDRSME